MRIATDGACIGNPGPVGWAWVREDGAWESGGMRHGTNNVGELMGLISAIEAHKGVPDLRIECDSQYAVNVANVWGHEWRRDGWINGSGKPVKNVELVDALLQLVDKSPGVEIRWVRGHNGHLLNEWADNRAVAAAARAKQGDESVHGTEYGDSALDLDTQPPKSQADRSFPSKKWKRQRRELMNLTEIGSMLGVSAIAAGRLLTDRGLRDRDTKLPTVDGAPHAKVRETDKYTQVLWKASVLDELSRPN